MGVVTGKDGGVLLQMEANMKKKNDAVGFPHVHKVHILSTLHAITSHRHKTDLSECGPAATPNESQRKLQYVYVKLCI